MHVPDQPYQYIEWRWKFNWKSVTVGHAESNFPSFPSRHFLMMVCWFMYNCFKNDLAVGTGGRATLQEDLRVLFHASYYNLTVLKQVFLPCKYIKLSLNHSSAKKLAELIWIYRKLTILIYKIKMIHTLGRSNKTQAMHAHCTHVSFCTRKKCNSNWAKVGVH